jgi:L-cystine uptake protein TcyP (sodium:dicarboxylate symporter family)
LGLFSTLLLIVAVVISLLECFLKEFTAKNRKIALFALIAIHVQLLVGIILYFVSPNGFNIKAVEWVVNNRKSFVALEHPLINIIAIALITIGQNIKN